MKFDPDVLIWRHSPWVAFIDDGERVALLNLSTPRVGKPLLLLGPAAAIWRAIDGQRGTSELVAAVMADRGARREDIATDVINFLGQLGRLGLAIEAAATELPAVSS